MAETNQNLGLTSAEAARLAGDLLAITRSSAREPDGMELGGASMNKE